jgi:3-oxoadipate enol-lactonase
MARVDPFMSTVCPGLWSIVDDDREASYRANADIGFTELQSPSLDTTPADLAGMALPTLVLAGSASHPSFCSVDHDLATVLPDARFVELYGSDHATYAERPDEFENAIRVFATKLDRRNTASA